MAPPHLDDEDRAATWRCSSWSAFASPTGSRVIDGARIIEIGEEEISPVVARYADIAPDPRLARVASDGDPVGQDCGVLPFRPVAERRARASLFARRRDPASLRFRRMQDQDHCGIGIHEVVLVHVAGIPSALGFLQPPAIRVLAQDPGYALD